MAKKKIAVITARADDCEQRDILYGIVQAAFHANADVAVFTNIYNHWVEDALLNDENIIYAIAMKCGYADEKYFARQFRQHVGCSPIQYRHA